MLSEKQMQTVNNLKLADAKKVKKTPETARRSTQRQNLLENKHNSKVQTREHPVNQSSKFVKARVSGLHLRR